MVQYLNELESDDSRIQPQSGVEGLNVGSASDLSWHQTVQFADGTAGNDMAVESYLGASTIGGDADELELGDFFARPVLIQKIVWTYDSLAFGATFKPWKLFFENPRVINRINNYNRLRGTLKVKFVVTGNGFYYGRMLCSYLPMDEADALTRARAAFQIDQIEATQRPHVFLDPSLSQGAEMHLPFFWPYEAVSIPDAEWNGLGRFDLFDMTGLRHAGGSTEPVTISVFAWSEDLELSIPTSSPSIALTPQSGREKMNGKAKGKPKSVVSKKALAPDEYGQGIISKPASIVANIAGRLIEAPYIGSYARATQIAAGSVSAIASLFGYSRPVDLEPITRAKIHTHSNMANCDATSLVTKLSVDSKQEVTVDTRVMGLGGMDEMNIKGIATRSAFLTEVVWLQARTPGDKLFTCGVHPGMYDQLVSEPLVEYHLLPCANMQELFSLWRGTMRYRFQIVASAFHRGRLRISWDPYGPDQGEFNTCYNYIVDIAEERDFCIDVGWGSTKGMLRTYPISEQPPPYSANFPPDDTPPGFSPEWSNGILTVSVFDRLTLPNSTALAGDLYINVFVSACDDIEFAAPQSAEINNFTPFAPQSGTEAIAPDLNAGAEGSSPLNEPVVARFATPPSNMENALATYSGEVIVSLRTLLKRVSYHGGILTPAFGNLITPSVQRIRYPTYPPFPGKDPFAFQTANSPSGFYSYFNMIPLQWVLMSFTGYRGGIRIHVTRSHTSTLWQNHYISRVSTYTQSGFAKGSEFVTAIGNGGTLGNLSSRAVKESPCGIAGENIHSQPSVEAEIPYYNQARFLLGKRRDQLSTVPNNVFNYFQYTTFGRSNMSDTCFLFGYSTGEDFQVGLFTGLPVLFQREDPIPT